jgi:hypothetical protein
MRTQQRGTVEANRQSLRTSLINLRVMYETAVNEMTRDREQLELLWPPLVGVQRLGFILIGLSDAARHEPVPAESLAQIEQELHAISQGLRVA